MRSALPPQPFLPERTPSLLAIAAEADKAAMAETQEHRARDPDPTLIAAPAAGFVRVLTILRDGVETLAARDANRW